MLRGTVLGCDVDLELASMSGVAICVGVRENHPIPAYYLYAERAGEK